MENPGVMENTCNTSYSGGRNRRILSVKPAKPQLGRPYLKNKIKIN
jgi:hypothetical protein